MPLVNRPPEFPGWIPDYKTNADAIEPSSTKKNLGFTREKLPYQWLNWLQANQSEWIEYLDSITQMKRAYLVDQSGGGQFLTLAEAISALPTGADAPSESDPFFIRLSPGTYDEDIILPEYVSIMGLDTLNCTISGMVTLLGYNTLERITLTQILPTRSNVRHIVLSGPSIIDSCRIETGINEAPTTVNGSTFYITEAAGVDTTIKNTSIINEALQSVAYRNLICSDVKYGPLGGTNFQVLNCPVFLGGSGLITIADFLIRCSGISTTPRISFLFQSSEVLPDQNYPSFTIKNSDDFDAYIGLHNEQFPGNLSPIPQEIFGEKTFRDDILFKTQPTYFGKLNLQAVSGYRGTYSLGSMLAETGYRGGVLTPGGLVWLVPYNANGRRSGYSSSARSHYLSTYEYDVGDTKKFIGGVALPTGFIFLTPHDYDGVKYLVDLNTFEPVDGPALPVQDGKYWGSVLLPEGRVFCVPYKRTNTDNLFNPFTGTWQSRGGLGPVPASEAFRGGVILPNGKVFCVPWLERTNFIYNPQSEEFEPGATAPNQTGEYSHLPNTFEGGVMLPNGKVLCLQGLDALDGPSPTSWLYDYLTDSWEETISSEPQIAFSGGCLLPNGLVIAAVKIGTTENYLYDYKINSWVPAAQTMSAGHSGAVLLQDGTAAIVPDSTTYVKLFSGPQGTRTAVPWCNHNMFNKF